MNTAREAVVVPRAEPRSYYGRPVVKPPVWTPEVPWYFFAGGLTGGAATLALVAEWRRNERLAWSARLVAMSAGTAGPVLLISDLGRPERFLNMLRVFKPTSPMSMGSWLLAVAGASNGLAAAWKLFGLFERVSLPARWAAGLSGPPMTTYTAALLTNTAIPVWREARHELPFVFAGSAAASAGGAVAALTPVAAAAPARRLAALGALLIAGGAGLVAVGLLDVPVLVPYVGWTIGALGMGVVWPTIPLSAMSEIEEGHEAGELSSTILMDYLGVGIGAGLGGASVALAGAGTLTIREGLAGAFAVGIVTALLLAVVARRLPDARAA